MQRQRLPASSRADLLVARARVLAQEGASRSSGSPACRSRTAARARAGTPPGADAARSAAGARPSTVVTSAPSAWTASIRHERTGSPSSRTVQAPQTPCSQPTCVPVRPSSWRRKSDEQQARLDLARVLAAVHRATRSRAAAAHAACCRRGRRPRAQRAHGEDAGEVAAIVGRGVDVAVRLDASGAAPRPPRRSTRRESGCPDQQRSALARAHRRGADADERRAAPRRTTVPVERDDARRRRRCAIVAVAAARTRWHAAPVPAAARGNQTSVEQLVGRERRREVAAEEVAGGERALAPRAPRSREARVQAQRHRRQLGGRDRRARGCRRSCRGCGSAGAPTRGSASASSGHALRDERARARASRCRVMAPMRDAARRARRCSAELGDAVQVDEHGRLRRAASSGAASGSGRRRGASRVVAVGRELGERFLGRCDRHVVEGRRLHASVVSTKSTSA